MREDNWPERYHERKVDRATPVAAEASSRVTHPSTSGNSASWVNSSSQSTVVRFSSVPPLRSPGLSVATIVDPIK